MFHGKISFQGVLESFIRMQSQNQVSVRNGEHAAHFVRLFSLSTRLRSGISCILLVIWLVSGNTLLPISIAQQPPELAQPDRQKQIADWISDLGDSDYSKREFATIQLNLNKKDAVRLAAKALETATGEQADRLFQLLSSIAADPYTTDGEFAYDAIGEIARFRSTSRAVRAQKILQAIGDHQQDVSQTKLLSMGIDVRDRQLQIISSKVEVPNALVIDETFDGDVEDLECIRWLSMVSFVKLEGARINRRLLTFVTKMPNLNRLQLVNTNLQKADIEVLLDAPELDLLEFIYAPIGDESIELISQLPVIGNLYLFGTQLTADGSRALKEKVDGPELLVSRGGFLGVQCMQSSVVIEDVVPNGAAQAAGLRRHDRVLSINGKPVYVFEDIRRELANHAPGEQVSIQFERSGFTFNDKQDLQPTKVVMETKATLLKRNDVARDR
jgi:hypothetical protein